MSYDSGDMSLGDSETIVSYNQSCEMYLTYLWNIWFLIALCIWWFVYWVSLSIFKYSLLFNQIFHKMFCHLKVTSVFLGQPSRYIFKSSLYTCQLTSLDIHIIPDRYSLLHGGKVTPTSHHESFWNFAIFNCKLNNPHRGTKTGCL